MTLWDLNEHQTAQITGFDPEVSPGLVTRLQELGFAVGSPVKCIKRPPFKAPRVFEVPGGVYTLEIEATRFIQVR